MNLIVVESPTKAKTLNRFLGADYRVVSTMGHIRDLPENRLGIKIVKRPDSPVGYEFLPQYILMSKKKEAVELIRKEAGRAEKIYLATDPDREGEAIAYHLIAVFSDGGLKIERKKFSRIAFHEITRSAVEKAIKSPGQINIPLVNAQQARRVLDRLVGYKLSPLLWVKIRRGLSAGRVQSVAVRLIVEREREIEKFVPEEYWEIWAELRRHVGGLKEGVPSFLAKLVKKNGRPLKIGEETVAKEAVEELKLANYEVFQVRKTEVLQSPPPPFTTSTLQQKAAQTLGFSSKRTMKIAQSLYEKGLITYHRTDSVALAREAVEEIRSYVKGKWGAQYLPPTPRFYKTKSKVAQEAHEAIRPTDIRREGENQSEDGLSKDEEKLYVLIWKRAVACQMNSAVWDQTKIEVQAAGQKNLYILEAEGKVLKFAGWLALYNRQKSGFGGENKEEELPELKSGDDLDLLKIDAARKFTQPPSRYTEASLIKTLEELGIGRPSTYAPTVSTIQDRQYVEKIEGKFRPTALGEVVNDFLLEYFPNIFDYQFTARMEDELDDIANGRRQWQPVVADFYGPFEEKLAGVARVAERVAVPVEATGEKCPKCGRGMLVIRTGRFGRFLSCSRFPSCDYTAPHTEKIEGVKCPECGGEVVVKKTKKGKRFYGCAAWPKCRWASWRKPK